MHVLSWSAFPNINVSQRVFERCKPFFVRSSNKKDRVTCCCRYHLEIKYVFKCVMENCRKINRTRFNVYVLETLPAYIQGIWIDTGFIGISIKLRHTTVMISYFLKLLDKFPSHMFRAKWQNTQLKSLVKNLPLKHCITVHDFSENFKCKEHRSTLHTVRVQHSMSIN
jgi:hypothetical protein